MPKVILYRLLQFPLILAVIYLLTFLLVWVAPGDPFVNEKNMDPIVVQTLKRRFHADNAAQFLAFYPTQVLTRGDFGWSMQYREWSVNDIIRSSLPVSVTLGLFALVIALLVGVGVGTLAAVQRGGFVDWASLSLTLIGISLPSFVTAAALLVAAAYTRTMPIGGWGKVSDIVLPGLALSLAPMAYIARLTRVSMLDVLGSDYVRTARAKGLPERRVVGVHALRNSLIPVVTFLGVDLGSLMAGAVVTEGIFNLPGIGQATFSAIHTQEYPTVVGIVTALVLIFILANLLVDVLYAVLDPRIRYR
jgi:peptide/nickel transport system permease protein/oligopeptide transport system permease protein